MSHPSAGHDGRKPPPRPRGRGFDLSSAPPSEPPSPTNEPVSNLGVPSSALDGSTTPSRTRSILNLTSSTLFGIYQSTGLATDREESNTPWGTGAQTPAEGGSFDIFKGNKVDADGHKLVNGRPAVRRLQEMRPHKAPQSTTSYLVRLILRDMLLFGTGSLYGLLVSGLHDRRQLGPVYFKDLDSHSWVYFFCWGAAGIALGETLPQLDRLWSSGKESDVSRAGSYQSSQHQEQQSSRRLRGGPGDWLDVVRSIGAFVGIAFAIRRLPWQSALQLALTLALANPAVWYLIDRTSPGFLLSTAVSLGGTAVVLAINPELFPSPSKRPGHSVSTTSGHVQNQTGGASGLGEDVIFGLFTNETVVVVTWIASVLFVTSICFGNVGRRLVPKAS